MDYDVLIIGGGPSGLACGKTTAQAGMKTLILERKTKIGKKVCAGGVTWNGLIGRLPEDQIERSFHTQYISTRLQNVRVTAPNPIIATVNREVLGQQMANTACQSGAELRTGLGIRKIAKNSDGTFLVRCIDNETFCTKYLVGADGSSSIVRRYLKVPVIHYGIGVNYQIHRIYKNMEWCLTPRLFHNGYCWIFPHRQTTSIGAYADRSVISASQLQQNLSKWAQQRGIDLSPYRASAERINFDYRGIQFGNIFLIGDAAGLASALTGEGIYPAIVSGEYAGKLISGQPADERNFKRLIHNHSLHRKIGRWSGKSKIVSTLLLEALVFGLRCKIIDFSAAEMAR